MFARQGYSYWSRGHRSPLHLRYRPSRRGIPDEGALSKNCSQKLLFIAYGDISDPALACRSSRDGAESPAGQFRGGAYQSSLRFPIESSQKTHICRLPNPEDRSKLLLDLSLVLYLRRLLPPKQGSPAPWLTSARSDWQRLDLHRAVLPHAPTARQASASDALCVHPYLEPQSTNHGSPLPSDIDH